MFCRAASGSASVAHWGVSYDRLVPAACLSGHGLLPTGRFASINATASSCTTRTAAPPCSAVTGPSRTARSRPLWFSRALPELTQAACAHGWAGSLDLDELARFRRAGADLG